MVVPFLGLTDNEDVKLSDPNQLLSMRQQKRSLERYTVMYILYKICAMGTKHTTSHLFEQP